MRLQRLELRAFGPFTGRSLDFTTGPPGLHIVFGPNEAGKSSSLRALKALLYGFPPQTPDNFLHSYDQLLVAGTLRNRAGQELYLQRRKKRLGDLLDADGNPLDQAQLAPFLGGVEAAIFATLFAIDHDTLVRGGEEILAQKGEVGQALFAAGAGLSSLAGVIAELEKEAAELFKASGSRPEINTALKRYRELQGRARSAALSASQWNEQRQALDQALRRRVELEEERDRLNTERYRLHRLLQAGPELAALATMREELDGLGPVPSLGDDFTERYQLVSRQIREAGQQLQRDGERLEKLAGRRQAIIVPGELLGQAELIDDFHQRLGEYRKGQKDRPERNGMRISLRSEAARLLKQVRADLPLEQIDNLRPLLARRITVQALSSRYESLRQRLAQVRKQGSVAERQYREAMAGLSAMAAAAVVEPKGLLLALRPAQQAGDLDEQLLAAAGDCRRQRQECLAELGRLGLWRGDLAALLHLALPLPATVQKFEQDGGQLAEEQRQLTRVRQQNERELQTARTEITALESAGEVPREEELRQAREKRQEGWQLVRRQWLGGEDLAAECRAYARQPLPEAYEGYVRQADQLADRLRREADRVAGAAALRSQISGLEQALAENGAAVETFRRRQQELQAAWVQVWQPLAITPLSPREMSAWLKEIDTLRFKAGELARKEHQQTLTNGRRADLRTALARELSRLGEEVPADEAQLGPLLLLAERVLERISRQKNELARLTERRDQAAGDWRQAKEECQAAEAALADWRSEWQRALAGLGGEEEPGPLEAVALLDTLQNSFDTLRDADDLQKRIDGIDRDAVALTSEVQALLSRVAPALAALPLEQAILQLRALLGQAQRDAALNEQLAGEEQVLAEELAAVGQGLQQARGQLLELLRLAGCAGEAELPAVIERSMDERRLREKIALARENLARIGGGIPLEELARQAAGVAADTLPGKVEALQLDIEQRLYPEINRISQVIGELETRLAAMAGGPGAVELAEEMEGELAGIRRLVERYTLVKLAARLLQQAIERYREEHQDPVLALASQFFQTLTTGSFVALRTDLDDRGEPVLVGLRPGGTRLTVDKMSSGTRDQLFLALRLASLEWRRRVEEPMPFIIDDILINFDDDRTRASLALFAELGEHNQVVLFTHHRRIVDEASRLAGEGVQIHLL